MGQSLDISPGAASALPAQTLHLARTLRLPRRTRVMDIGANPANVPAYAALRDADLCDVHGFEPGAEAFQRLKDACRPNEVYHQAAVGIGETFYLTRGGSFASMLRPDLRQIEALGHWSSPLTVTDEIAMEAKPLDTLDLPKPDMLKMDTQGSELAILESGQTTLSDAVVIMPEIRFFALYQGDPMMGRVDMALREMGFMLHKILPGATVRLTSSRIDRLRPVMTRNQMVDADAIYVRDMAYPDAMSDGQLGHLALLADAVLGSIDLCLRCLDLLAERGVYEESEIDAYVDALPPNVRVRA